MPEGPGKYDNECSLVREMSQAAGVAIIVVQGNRGSGFSVQVTDRAVQRALPAMLRSMADQIEEASE